jgi:hypothetical protein
MFSTNLSDRNNGNKRLHLLSSVAVTLIVAAMGTYLLLGSHADTPPYASSTATNGTVSSGASQQACSGASTGSCVVFGQSVPMDGNVALALSQPGTPFAASSFWNTPLPDNAPVNVNNASYISDIQYDLCHYYPVEEGTPSEPGYPCVIPGNGAPSTSTYSGPLYVVPANQPYLPFSRICNGVASPNVSFDNSIAGGVPIPADAHAAAGTDAEIQIYQPSTNKYWDFWRLTQDNSGNWGACWGGTITDVSDSNGITPNNLGATATSLPLLGGVVRIEELQAGQIDHVMGLELNNNLKPSVIPTNTPGAANGTSWPATRSDGTDTSPLAIPEGLRFQLNPNLDLNTLDLTPVGKIIAVAAQKYGFVVYDTTASVGIRFGDPTTYTNTPSPDLPNPYTTGPGVDGVGTTGLFEGVAPYLIFKNFPWDQLQALPFNYGEPTD